MFYSTRIPLLIITEISATKFRAPHSDRSTNDTNAITFPIANVILIVLRIYDSSFLKWNLR